jgi:hypothetical protein
MGGRLEVGAMVALRAVRVVSGSSWMVGAMVALRTVLGTWLGSGSSWIESRERGKLGFALPAGLSP